MMKKAIKKLLAALLAVAMVCAMAIPAFAYDTKEDLNTKHEYDAFQIFKGDVTGNDTDGFKISNVTWGKNIPHPEDFLEKLTEDSTIGGEFKTDFTPQEAVAVISKWHDSDNNSIAFARFVCNYIYTDSNANREPVIQGGHTGGFELPMAGYYLIVDTSPFSGGDSYHAYNSFLLKVNQKNYHVQITPKVVKPTVKKEVYDNDDGSSSGDNNGWGSSADHAINEEFKFRLIAKLPESENNGHAYDYYDKYSVIFHDTLSDGITFDKLDTVEITNGDGSTPQVINNYTLDPNNPQSSFKLSIDDVKTCVPDLNKGATITVTYTAHLNEKAYVNTVGGGTDNKNSVYLEYSNNPRISTSLDHTPESEVRVYTYQLNNTKYHDDDTPGHELAGAGFRLYSGKDCTKEQEIKLKKNTTDGTYSPYFGTDAGDEMISDNKGQFNVKGLDAGTYYLRETKTPDDYSACPDKEIVISATHDVNHVSLSGDLNNKIINKKAGGIALPSTGGIGTTLFYVVGGGLMVAAIVLLVTKKRMENK